MKGKKFGPKMIILIIALCIVGLALLGMMFFSEESRSRKSQFTNSDDFNFRLNFNTYGRDQIDTYNATFTKDLVQNGTKTIDFVLPENVKEDILTIMLNMDIMDYPDSLSVVGRYVTPSCDYVLTVTINNITKTIVWDEGLYPFMTEGLPKQNIDFLKLVEFVRDYIYSTDEYKQMPKAKGGYD